MYLKSGRISTKGIATRVKDNPVETILVKRETFRVSTNSILSCS
ncbi:hypothetical protein SAMN04489761_0863 [Tenacibaculum sp. MAR_2009_124]|nr:hypothetical protein SAMN04489761_0863 [Tenacibaculum sp. MAR_2009_124]